jgi:hypothetical protein
MLCNAILAVVEALQAQPILRGDHGPPDDTVGKDGDFYIDLDTGDFYLKENGTWH